MKVSNAGKEVFRRNLFSMVLMSCIAYPVRLNNIKSIDHIIGAAI